MARLTPIMSKDQVVPEYQSTIETIAAAHGSMQGPYSIISYAPELAGRLAHAGTHIRFESPLDARIKNLAALTTAREFDCQYVWGAQSGAARRQGIPESTIDAVRARTSEGIPPEDAQIVDFTQRLIRNHRIDDATFEALKKRLGEALLIELTCTIGYYSMAAMSLNAAELEPGPGAEVLQPQGSWSTIPPSLEGKGAGG
ncbi:MAG TPA: carboxymuconolactone decarboxylase family protein [Dehalococcoidia bacterium]|nr:carboxymuconolactone decarboxylase family protein [Dehalococcoidia bacterium]